MDLDEPKYETAEEADFVVCMAVTSMVFDVKQPEETGLCLRGAILGQHGRVWPGSQQKAQEFGSKAIPIVKSGVILGQHVGAWSISQQKAQEFRLKTVGKFSKIIGLESKVFLDDSEDSIIETIVGSRCDLGEGNVVETGFARLEQAVRAAVTFLEHVLRWPGDLQNKQKMSESSDDRSLKQ